MSYKFLEHTADLKVLVKEKSLEKAFSSSAQALKEAIVGKIQIEERIDKKIEVRGKDLERVLYEFLEQFLYLLDAEDFLVSNLEDLEIELELDGIKLSCLAWGDKASKYKFTNDVKAITYNEMIVSEAKNQAIIQFVLDV